MTIQSPKNLRNRYKSDKTPWFILSKPTKNTTKQLCKEELELEAKDSYGNITQKTISITFADTQVKERTKAFGKIRFISEKYYGKNKAGGLMENSRWLNDPEFNFLLRKALAI